MRNISLKTISGRFIFMTLLFFLVTTGFTILVINQNRQSTVALHSMQEVRIPIRLIAGNIIGSIDRVMSLQRGYMMSGNVQFNEDRQRVYDEEIFPSIETLNQLKNKLERDREQIEAIVNTVNEFKKVQDGILDYFETHILPPMQQIDAAGVDEWPQMTETFITQAKEVRELNNTSKLPMHSVNNCLIWLQN